MHFLVVQSKANTSCDEDVCILVMYESVIKLHDGGRAVNFQERMQGAGCQNDSEPKSGYCFDVNSSKKSRKHYFGYIQIR